MRGLACGAVALAIIACSAGAALAQRANDLTPSPPGAEVYFVELKDGAIVPEKFKIYFGLRNMGVAPAGSDTPNTGHHHLIVDSNLPPLNLPIPNDFKHLHFGAAQTEAEVTLVAGQAHPPAGHGRQGAYSALAAGDVAADHRHGGAEGRTDAAPSRRAPRSISPT